MENRYAVLCWPLLRMQRERRYSRADEEPDELAPVHAAAL